MAEGVKDVKTSEAKPRVASGNEPKPPSGGDSEKPGTTSAFVTLTTNEVVSGETLVSSLVESELDGLADWLSSQSEARVSSNTWIDGTALGGVAILIRQRAHRKPSTARTK